MRPLYETGAALLTSALLLPATVDAITMNCKELRASGVSFNFEKLGGPKTLSLYESEPPGHRNTTFTIDICKPLKVPSDKKERAKTCPAGTQGEWTMSVFAPGLSVRVGLIILSLWHREKDHR